MKGDFSKKAIGKRIKNLREEKKETSGHCTQADLGKAMGVNANQIRKWENGNIDFNSEKIVALADYFNVSCDRLLRGGDKEYLTMMNQTGLSNESLEVLTEINNDCLDPGYSIIALNTIIADKQFLSLLGQYFCYDFDSISFISNLQLHQLSLEWLGGFNPFLAESGLEPLARMVIGDHLKKLREEVRNGKS